MDLIKDSCDLNSELSMRLCAIDLARRGFYVFPVAENQKAPAMFKQYTPKATRDEATITQWWTQHPRSNIAIATSVYKDGKALIVVDVDKKNGVNGFDQLLELELNGNVLPRTYTQKTAGKGEHLVYVTEVPVQQGTAILGPGVDIRSNGGYIVACGSRIDGVRYTCNLLDPVAAPDWLVEKCGMPRAKSEKVDGPEGINKVRAAERALFYLKSEAPIATAGNRNHMGYQAAARLKDFGVDSDECLVLMAEHWRCEPMIDHKELEQVVSSAYKYGNAPVGVSSPEADFPAEPLDPESELSYLEKLNKEYALVYIEDSHFILHETLDEKGRFKRVFLNERTFKRRFSPELVQLEKGKDKSKAEIWLDWSKRREFQGLCFLPELTPKNGYYNLWNGFTTAPLSYEDGNPRQRMGFDRFIEHAKENVCRGDNELFLWLMGYFAQLIQKPYERPLTTLVFRGAKGTGKNALVDRIGQIIGPKSYIVAHDVRYLTSNFNGHLDSCLCMVLDEAFWSGDKAAEGKLKGLSTAPEIMIERKGQEPYMVDNFVRLIVIGNENWLVPASVDERRYAVFDVGDGKKQQGKYFEEMRLALDQDGGNRILFSYLKTFDLSTVDVNKAPVTEALMDQKHESMDPFYQWWGQCLEEGLVAGLDFEDHWPTALVGKDAFRNAYKQYFKDRNIRGRFPDSGTIGRLFHACLPVVVTKRKRSGTSFHWTYEIPDLAGCRKHWEKYVGHTIAWPMEEE